MNRFTFVNARRQQTSYHHRELLKLAYVYLRLKIYTLPKSQVNALR